MNTSAGRGFLKAIILVGVLFAIIYFIHYNKWANHDFNTVDITYKTNQNQEDNTEEDIEIKDSTSDYKTLYSKLNYELLEFNFGEEFYDIYYGNKSFYDEYFIYIGVVNLLKNDMILNCDLQTSVNESDLNKEIKSIFGDVSYTNKSFTTKNGNVAIEYDSSSNKYNVKLNGKCSGFSEEFNGIKSMYLKAEVVGDNLFIYERPYYVESFKDVNGNLSFKYHKGIEKDSEVIATDYNKFDMTLIPIYKYTFLKSNDGYKLESIKIK